MAKAKTTPKPQRSPLFRGYQKVMFSLTPAQVAALRALAFKRAAAAGRGRPDASELVREALDAWLGKTGRTLP